MKEADYADIVNEAKLIGYDVKYTINNMTNSFDVTVAYAAGRHVTHRLSAAHMTQSRNYPIVEFKMIIDGCIAELKGAE